MPRKPPLRPPPDPLAPAGAVAWFRERLIVTDDEFHALEDLTHDDAFTIAGVAELDLVSYVWEQVDRAIANGESLGTFQERVADRLAEAWSGEQPWRVECLTGDALVSGGVIRAAHRRWFEGRVVEVVTDKGRHFTATPNHPMLTRDGWKGAGALRQGDNLVGYNRKENPGSTRDEHIAEPPARIDHVFDALPGSRVVQRISRAGLDFHGDGPEGEVEVVRADRPLSFGAFAPLRQPLEHHVFSPAAQARARFCDACGHLLLITERCGFCDRPDARARFFESAADRVVACAETIRERLRALACKVAGQHLVNRYVVAGHGWAPAALEVDSAGLGGRAHWYARFAQHVEDRALRRADRRASGPRALTQLVQANRLGSLLGRELLGRTHQPPAAHDLLDPSRRSADLACDLPGAQAGDVEFDRVRSVRVRKFSGHVFNLSTAHGYFAIDGILTGNTILRTNVQRAYSVSRYSEMTRPEVKEARPYMRFSAILDARTTPECEESDGIVLPQDDPWWRTHIPPLHFACRSHIVTLSESEAAEEGIDPSGPAVGAADGFGSVPEPSEFDPNLDEYPPDIAAAYHQKGTGT